MGKRKIITNLSEYPLASMISILIYTILSCFFLLQSSARDNITVDNPLSDEETLVSARERFQLGFFSHSQASLGINRYVGIWYHNSNPRIFVWVANRDHAIPHESGVLAIADGELKLSDKNLTVYFRTGDGSSTSPVAKLMDNGNLVLLRDNEPGTSYLWESFKHPTDTFLPGMKMDKNLVLTSWKSQQDPGPGDFTFKMDQDENQFQIVSHSISRYWRNAEMDEISPEMLYLLSNFSGTVSKSNSTNVSSSRVVINYSNFSNPTINYSSTRLIMRFNGEIQFWRENNVKNWSLSWSEPRDNCSVFHYCGNFAICNSNSKPKCKCLEGFEPVSQENWKSGEFSDGCAGKSVSCGENYTVYPNMKVSTRDLQHIQDLNETGCSEECRENPCLCTAYSFEPPKRRDDPSSPGKCWIWTKELYDLRENIANGGLNISVRVAASHLESIDNSPTESLTKQPQEETLNGSKAQWALIVGVTTTSVFILSCTVIYFYNRRKRITNQEDTIVLRRNMVVHFYDSEGHVKDMVDSGQFEEEDKKGIDLPFFDFESIIAATDNFSEANKLGKGGFGPVYKGKFPGGQEIAVKRLSSVSGQGLIEFKNEVILIARLQHRNLVRLVGYCIHGIEKILLYEYMPNKSLDIFIFDVSLSGLLDWEMRFNIILGIARGLLYLHQDSRLLIIHRDLKTSNILLDKEMNPKISDFGLARIFEEKNTEGTTNRVVGTYGYMSPEYALNGFFSVKSDVFSFGVVVLEIISGKRNTGFYNSEQALSLLGYAWKLWEEDKVLDIMDQQLNATSKINEILKCINVALLCVQEDPNDRPTMSNVVIMLSSEPTTLPTPSQPAFALRKELSSSVSSSSKAETSNKLTMSFEGR